MNVFLDRLIETAAQFVVEAIVGLALAAGTAVMAASLARRGKVQITTTTGRTCMSPYVLLVGMLCGGAAAAFLVLGLIEPESLREPGAFAAWAGLVGGFSLAFLAILPFTRHTWEWDEAGLRWRGALRGVTIPWADIARVGKSWGGRYFAADKAGRRIYWSTYTLEHEALDEAIRMARPDLTDSKVGNSDRQFARR
jgi:hypothetical protein